METEEWFEWDTDSERLLLDDGRRVVVRQGDELLGYWTDEGRLVFVQHRPRTVH